jgi:putative two-component system response regulator
MARVRLERHYEVITASGGEDALRMVDEGLTPDIVLLDIDMPGMDGFEAFALMRKRQAMEHVPIVFLTSLASEEDKMKGLGMGIADYLTKPFEGSVITLRIPMYVKAARERRKLREMEKSGVALIDEGEFARLTPLLNVVEKDVARLALLGKSNAEIGEKLSYSSSYVKKLMFCIYNKLGVNSRDELRKIFISADEMRPRTFPAACA